MNIQDEYNKGRRDFSNLNFENANLENANLKNANLRNANLRNANLENANLTNATINWISHELIAKLLFINADKDVQKRMIAGLVVLSTDFCWDDFLKIEHKYKDWALDTLAKYVKEGDNVPDVLKNRIK